MTHRAPSTRENEHENRHSFFVPPHLPAQAVDLERFHVGVASKGGAVGLLHHQLGRHGRHASFHQLEELPSSSSEWMTLWLSPI